LFILLIELDEVNRWVIDCGEERRALFSRVFTRIEWAMEEY